MKQSPGNGGTLRERPSSSTNNNNNEVIDLCDSSSEGSDSDIEVVAVKKSPQSAASAKSVRPDSAPSNKQGNNEASMFPRRLYSGKSPLPGNAGAPPSRSLASASRQGNRIMHQQPTRNSPKNQQQAARRPKPAGRRRNNPEVIVLLESSSDESVHARPSPQEKRILQQQRQRQNQQRAKATALKSFEIDDSSSENETPTAGTKRPADEPDFDSSDDEMATIAAWNRRKQTPPNNHAATAASRQHHQEVQRRHLDRTQIRDLRRQFSPSRKPKAASSSSSPPRPLAQGEPKRKLLQLRPSPKVGRSNRAMQKKAPPPPTQQSAMAAAAQTAAAGNKSAAAAKPLSEKPRQLTIKEAICGKSVRKKPLFDSTKAKPAAGVAASEKKSVEYKTGVDGRGGVSKKEAVLKEESAALVEESKRPSHVAEVRAAGAESGGAATIATIADQTKRTSACDSGNRQVDSEGRLQSMLAEVSIGKRKESVPKMVDSQTLSEREANVALPKKPEPCGDDGEKSHQDTKNSTGAKEADSNKSLVRAAFSIDPKETDIQSNGTDVEFTLCSTEESLGGAVLPEKEPDVVSMNQVARSGSELEDSVRQYTFDDDSVDMTPLKPAASGTDSDDDDESYQEVFRKRRSRPNGVFQKRILIPPNARLGEGYDSHFPIEPQRDSVKVRVRNLEHTNPDYQLITTIDHLTKEYLNERGLPVKEMVVHTGEDDILYKLRLHVEESRFQYGAFLTYLGAYRLKASEAERGVRMIDKRRAFFPETTQSLEVADIDGWTKTLRITGENLHGNNNNCYWPVHTIPGKGKTEQTQDGSSVHATGATGNSVYYDEEDERDVKHVAEKLRRMKQKGLEPIGHLGIYSIDDYESAPELPCALSGFMVDMGRYGPFSNADRKRHSVFDFKSFLFKNQPCRYPFEAGERLDGELQIIDVTDDITGLPHAEATKHIPMYVNEVGHTIEDENKQTVFDSLSDCERIIRYNIALPDGLLLQQNKSIELLSNYGQSFEPTRELEGYGIRNLYEGLPAINDSLSRRIDQGVTDRKDFQNMIEDLCPLTISNALEQITEVTHEPVSRLIDNFVVSGDASSISALQIIANRRVEWLGKECLRQLFEKEDELDRLEAQEEIHESDAYVRRLSIKQARECLGSWKAHKYLLEDGRSDTRTPRDGKLSISEILRMEAQEDVAFELRDQLVEPFNPALWCKVACRLIERLIDIVHYGPFCPWTEADEVAEKDRYLLENEIVQAVQEAVEMMRTAMEQQSYDLHFSSGLTQDHVVRGTRAEILAVVKSSDAFYLDCTTTPKAFTAEILRRSAALGKMDSEIVQSADKENADRPLFCAEKFVMVNTIGVTSYDSLSGIASIPHAASEESLYLLNSNWYKLWQIAFPAIAFVNRYIPSLSESAITKLCNVLNLKRDWIDFALERGIREKSKEKFERVCVPKQHVIKKQVSLLAHHRSADDYEDDDDEQERRSTGRSCGKRPRRDRIARPGRKRLQIDEALGGKRPVGSGRCGVTAEQMLASEALSPASNSMVNSFGGTRPKAVEVWSGKPDEMFFPKSKEPINWPDGWKKKVYQRASGDTRGTTDRYWFTPVEEYKLRSLNEVARFFECMEICGQDEKNAWKVFKGKTR